MGQLYENRAAPIAKPLMADLAAHLSPRAQADLGRWAIKTTLLFAIADNVKNGRRHFEPLRRTLLRMVSEDVPPDGGSVRIGRFPAGRDAPEGETAQLVKLLPGGAPRGIQVFAVATLAHLAFEVVIGDPRHIRGFVAGTKNCDRLIRVWPPNAKGVDYPPIEAFSRADVLALRNAYYAAIPHLVFVRKAAGRDFLI
jgi:hypothetical protein